MNVYPPKGYIFDELYSWDEGSELSPVMFAWSAIDVRRMIVDVDSFCFLFICAGLFVLHGTWSAIVPFYFGKSVGWRLFLPYIVTGQ